MRVRVLDVRRDLWVGWGEDCTGEICVSARLSTELDGRQNQKKMRRERIEKKASFFCVCVCLIGCCCCVCVCVCVLEGTQRKEKGVVDGIVDNGVCAEEHNDVGQRAYAEYSKGSKRRDNVRGGAESNVGKAGNASLVDLVKCFRDARAHVSRGRR